MPRVRALSAAAIIAAASAAHPALAQRGPASASLTPRCSPSGTAHDTLGRRALPNGYTVTIGRVEDPLEYGCVATLRDRRNRIVRADSGFGAAVVPSTGMDVDGDGTPELILEMDTGGGNHCCWNYTVISLGTPARLLLTFPWSGATEFRRDSNGDVTLWSWEGGLFGTEPSMASRLFAQRVYRYTSGALVDVTPAHCAAIRADTTRYQTPRPDADAIRRLNKFGPGTDSSYGIAGDIESLMLQEVFCRRFDAALGIAREMWPAATRGAFIAKFRSLVAAAYKEYADGMRDWK